MSRLAFAGASLLAQALGGGTAHAARTWSTTQPLGSNVELAMNGADARRVLLGRRAR